MLALRVELCWLVSVQNEPPMRSAVIDVGTNSVKLLVGEVAGGAVHPLHEASQQTRLGKDFYHSHILQRDAIELTAQSVSSFALKAQEWQPQTTRVIATSAARDARNATDLLEAIERASQLKVEVISGDVEADWAFRGVTSDSRLTYAPLLIVDVGGGSTELILGQGETQVFRQSFALGTVRLLEQTRLPDPPSAADFAGCIRYVKQFMRTEAQPALKIPLQNYPRDEIRLVATGGTASILARVLLQTTEFDREKIESRRLSREWVSQWRNAVWRIPLAERKKIIGLPPNRADVILGGVAILAAVMEELDFESMTVSTRGLRFGALLAFASQNS